MTERVEVTVVRAAGRNLDLTPGTAGEALTETKGMSNLHNEVQCYQGHQSTAFRGEESWCNGASLIAVFSLNCPARGQFLLVRREGSGKKKGRGMLGRNICEHKKNIIACSQT